MMSTADSEVSFGLTSRPNKYIGSYAGYPGNWEGYYLLDMLNRREHPTYNKNAMNPLNAVESLLR